MPYHIGAEGSYGCKGFPVVKDSDNEVMGCHDTKEDAERQLAALYANEKVEKSEGFVPPQEVRNNAKRGLELREKHGRGGTEVGVARARDLSNGRAVSLDTINRMVSYFARHEVDKEGEGWGKDSAGYIAWLLWGGDAGRTWANKIKNQNDKKDKAMAMDFTTSYAEIVKFEKQEDGTAYVYGKATDDTLDLDSQICDPKWLNDAMPRWFKSGGNVREMHGPSAAGIAKEYEAKADGHYIGVHVVDAMAVKKCETGVYQGFSIGIKSPRVIQDTKAANGRIIDGQIIEVSLVDRPANPSAKLILAKTVEGEPSLVQVEELVSEENETTKGSKMEQLKQIEELAKSLTTIDVAKFDKTLFDNARRALAELIAAEALEMKEGHDERYSLATLASAVNALMAWYEGEEHEGEVKEIVDVLEEKSAEADCEDGKCGKCAACMDAKAVKPDDSTEEEESDQAPDTQEDDDEVDIDDKEKKKSADIEEPVVEENSAADEVAETPAEETPAEEAPSIEDVVEKAVKSAMEAVKSEIDALRADKEAAVTKAVELETELATALSKTVAGGPKRTATKLSEESRKDTLVKASILKSKADATTDPLLRKGYMELYDQEIEKFKATQTAK